MTTETKQLIKGDRCDESTLECIGWIQRGKIIDDPEGYNCWDYFRDGVYLGPDVYGIEPMFVSAIRTKMTKITIYKDDVWAGEGRIDRDGEIVDCPAVLGPDQDASDDTYEAICDALDVEPQDADRYTGTGSVERPDGIYSWIVSE